MPTPPLTTEDNFVQEVRDFMRDFPQLNRLNSGEETSNRLIKYCVYLALDEFNTTPPLSGLQVSDFPSRTILLALTVIYVLTSVSLLKSRNRLRYNDGGFSVDTESQEDSYRNMIGFLRQTAASEAKISRLKIALNIEGGWDAGVGSEYGWIHGWYGLT